jgi:hypothetical protein
MKRLLYAIAGLALWQKMVVGAMLALVLMTWLAACLVLFGFLGP